MEISPLLLQEAGCGSFGEGQLVRGPAVRRRRGVGLRETVQRDAEQADGPHARLGLFEERDGASGDLFRRPRRRVVRVAARDRLEVRVTQLQYDGPREELLSRKHVRRSERQAMDLTPDCFEVLQVLRESVLA